MDDAFMREFLWLRKGFYSFYLYLYVVQSSKHCILASWIVCSGCHDYHQSVYNRAIKPNVSDDTLIAVGVDRKSLLINPKRLISTTWGRASLWTTYTFQYYFTEAFFSRTTSITAVQVVVEIGWSSCLKTFRWFLKVNRSEDDRLLHRM